MSRLAKSFALFLSFAGLLSSATNANALACTSVATGNWGVAGTWTSVGNCNRVPTAADTVTIATGNTITVNVATANVLSVTVNSGAILTQTLALSTAGALSVAGTLTSNNAMTITGATTVTGNLSIVGAGARTFTGLVTVTGGTWNNSGNRAVTFSGGITNNGTFTAGTGTQTFNSTQAIGGASPINFGGIVAIGNNFIVTNNNTNVVTITGNLTGGNVNSTWVNAANSTLNYGSAAAPMATGVLTATAAGNVVNYTGAGQTVKATSYATLNVTGTATNSGTVTVATALGGAGTLTNAATGRLNIGGTSAITTLTATAAGNVVNYTGAGQTVKATSYATLNVTGTATNSGTVTVATALGGAGTLTNAATGILNIGGTSTITTLTATAAGNTVNYTGAAQTVKATAYSNLGLSGSGAKTLTGVTTVGGNLTLSGTATATTAANFSIGGNLVVGAGTTFTSANFTNSVTGTTSVTGTLAHSGVAAKTYVGAVTINAGGVWTNAGNAPVTFRGGLTHNGATFTAGTGIYTFSTTAAQSINCAAALAIPSITVTTPTVLTNNCNLTVSTALAGTGNFTNGATGTLNIGFAAAPAITTLTATAVGNTVNYNMAGAQAVRATTYHHLGFGGALAKTAAAGLTVNGDLTFSGTATFTAGAFTHNFAGSWIVNTTAAAPLSVATTSIINFNTPATPAPTSMGGTTVATIAFADVNINNTSGVTFNDNASFQTGTTPTLTVAAGATLTPAAAVVISGTTGTLTGSGTVQVTRTAAVANFASQYTIATKTLTNLTIDFAGVGTAQTVDVLTYGSATGGGLKVSNTSGVSLTANTTVAGTLTLASGAVSTGAFILITSKACNAPSVVRTGGHVAGFLRKNIPVGAPVNCTFEVGDAATYRPINTTFVSVATAGNLVGSVSQAAGEHPQCCGGTPFGLDPAKDVNRYWTLTNPGGIIFTTYSATFNFINPTDFDAGAAPANFEVENWSGAAWLTTTAGTRTLTSTQASGLTAFGDFAVGEKKPTNPGAFDAYDTTTTPAAALTGNLRTKIAGAAFTFDIAALNPAKTALFATFVGPVKVELLDSSDNSGVLDPATACRSTWTTVIQTLSNQTFNAAGDLVITGASGRHRVTPSVTENNVWKDVRVRVSFPALLPTVISCATDRFAIRPNNLVIIQSDGVSFGVTDSNWQTAGTTRNLSNLVASGGNVHKAGQPFTISATAYNAAGTVTSNYAGSPDTATLSACAGTACTASFGTGVALGTWAADPGPGANGKVKTNTASYPEVGAFNLTLEDRNFAAVDSADTAADCTASGYYVCSAAVSVGRFVPDHFDVTGLITPTFKTFNVTDAACSTGAAPRRTFTYIGQPFGYLTTPQATVYARNAAASTTVNYSGTLWKIGGTSSSSKDCATNPDICLFTTSWTGGGNSSSVAESYAYTLTPLSTPSWDNASAATAAATVTPGAGTGTIAISSSNTLAFLRNTTTPQAAFTANITNTVSVQDASESGVAGNGTITTTTPLVFNGTGSGIAFDAGNEFRYGRLKLSNAYGSELLNLPVPIQTQYWNGTAFVTNTADNCTTLIPGNIKLTTTLTGVSTTVGGAFSSGIGSLVLTKPTPAAKGVVGVCVDLDSGVGGDTTCQATTPAAKLYLQTGAAYTNDPTARATFGVYKGSNQFIYMRENY